MAAGKLPSKELQSWNGFAWNQAPIGGGPPHSLPPQQRPKQTESTAQPLAGAEAANDSGSAIHSIGNGSSAPAQSNGSGSPQQQRSHAASNCGDASATSAAALRPAAEADQGMSTFVAQAMLTAHYSINRAFLLEHPILEVREPPKSGCCIDDPFIIIFKTQRFHQVVVLGCARVVTWAGCHSNRRTWRGIENQTRLYTHIHVILLK